MNSNVFEPSKYKISVDGRCGQALGIDNVVMVFLFEWLV